MCKKFGPTILPCVQISFLALLRLGDGGGGGGEDAHSLRSSGVSRGRLTLASLVGVSMDGALIFIGMLLLEGAHLSKPQNLEFFPACVALPDTITFFCHSQA